MTTRVFHRINVLSPLVIQHLNRYGKPTLRRKRLSKVVVRHPSVRHWCRHVVGTTGQHCRGLFSCRRRRKQLRVTCSAQAGSQAVGQHGTEVTPKRRNSGTTHEQRQVAVLTLQHSVGGIRAGSDTAGRRCCRRQPRRCAASY